MTARWSTALALGALALGGVTCAKPAGLEVDVDVGTYAATTAELRVVLHAPKGFKEGAVDTMGGPGVTQEDVDGDGTRDLVIRYLSGYSTGTERFLVTTDNPADLTITGEALAFDTTTEIAYASNSSMLPAGGRTTLRLTLGTPPASQRPAGRTTRTEDLLTTKADATVQGPAAGAGAASIAVCALTGDGQRNDLVIGVPGFNHDMAHQQSGAVFVLRDVAVGSSVVLDQGNASQLSFFGVDPGDHLGTAVACADVDGDGFDDIIAGAPNAVLGAGRVYLIKGRQAIETRPVDLSPTATSSERADGTWGPAVAPPNDKVPGFGSLILATDTNGDHKAELWVAAPAYQKVHLLPPAAANDALMDVEQADHPVFTGVPASSSIAAGDFDGTKTGIDVAIGDPNFIPMNEISSTGAVYLFANVDPAGTTAIAVSAAVSTIVGGGGAFGKAVLALETTGYGQDLLVGAPGDGNGLVYAYGHDPNFFHAATRDHAKTTKGAPLDLGDKGAGFGGALGPCANGTSASPTFGLVVGASETSRGNRMASGSAFLLGTGGTFSLLEVVYGVATNDRLGSAVACGDFDGDLKGDLVTVAPAATGVGAGAGVVYVERTPTP